MARSSARTKRAPRATTGDAAHDATIPFMPAAVHGHHMDEATFRARQHQATEHQLAQLMASQEYHAFNASKQARHARHRVVFTRTVWGALVAALVLVLSNAVPLLLPIHDDLTPGNALNVEVMVRVC